MFDCHVHSFFSVDSEMKTEDACEKAINVGLAGIAFTDHLDFDFPGMDESVNIDFDYYSNYMDSLKENQAGRLKVLKGIEVGIQPHVIERTDAVVKGYDFDYVLASVHIVEGQDTYISEYFEGKSKRQAYGRYLEEILFMIRNFKDFNNVGHFEYVTRNACYDDRSLKYDDYCDIFDEIFRELISNGKGFEVNTSSFRDKPGRSTPDYDIKALRRYRELGGEIISLGSDSHDTGYIGYKFGLFCEMLKEAGFRHTVHFENRMPVFDKL